MLKNISPILTPDLLWALAAMGHGDRLVIVDANYPAYSRHQRTILLPGVTLVEAVKEILSLLPVDDFIEFPAMRMVSDGGAPSMLPVHLEVQALLNSAEGRSVGFQAVERTPFYELASKAFAVVATTDNSAYGCFVLTKGVVRTSANPGA